jgi:hypothetical protein
VQHKTRKQTLFVPSAFILLFALVVGSAGILGPSAMAQSRPKVIDEAERTRSPEQSPRDTGQQPAPAAGRVTADVIPKTADVIPKQETPEIVSPAQNRAWTSASSTGAVDEDSAAIVQLKNFTVTLLPGATGSVHVRYNITATAGISAFCPATQSTFQVRYRNSDTTGTHTKVFVELHSTNISSGGNVNVYTFITNGLPAGSSFMTASATPAIDFDFSTNIYWIDATIFRDDPNLFADLGSIQIWENAGTPCP